MTQSGRSGIQCQTEEASIGIVDLLRALIILRYMFAGLIIGSVIGLAYKRLAYGSLGSGASLGSNAGDDALVIITIVCTLVGMALDIRRGLTKRG